MLEGTAKIYIASPTEKNFLLGFGGPGEVFGIASTVLGRACEASAQVILPVTAVAVPRAAFINLLESDAQARLEVTKLLSQERFDLLERMGVIGLSTSALQRLAMFLVKLRPRGRRSESNDDRSDITQDTLSQLIGLPRETVSRLVCALKREHVLRWGRSTLVVQDWKTLEKLAGLKRRMPYRSASK